LKDTTLVFRTQSYDFDEALAAQVGAQQVSWWGAAKRILQLRPRVVEVNEPLFFRAWPLILSAVAAARVVSLRGRRVDVVSYAIENLDPQSRFEASTMLPKPVTRSAAGFAVRRMTRLVDRIAFGTQAAFENYRPHFSASRTETKTFAALSAPCYCREPETGMGVVFLGSLEERKGLPDVLSAWEIVEQERPELHLVIAGTGPLARKVQEFASHHPSVRIVSEPSRSTIHQLLAESKVLVLPSRSTATWKEQVGLPILEGLSHGTQVVSTTDSGLADWLDEHGHRVLRPGFSSRDLADAILSAALDTRTASEVQADLPALDGRNDAALWLLSA